jgi:hypothetical protein
LLFVDVSNGKAMLTRVHKGPKPTPGRHGTDQVQTIIGIYSKLLASSWNENAALPKLPHEGAGFHPVIKKLILTG